MSSDGKWPTMTLAEAGVVLLDCVHKTPPKADAGYPYLSIPEMVNGHLDLEAARRISHQNFVEWTRKVAPQAHDVVLSRRCNPGETAYVSPNAEFALGQNLVLLRADGRYVYPPFLRWLTRSSEWWEQVRTFLNVGAVFDSLKCADVPNFRVPIPPLSDQQRITKVLDGLDDKIELNRKMNATLEAMAQAIFKSWFVDFDPVRAKMEGREPAGMDAETAALFPDRFEVVDGREVPVGWRIGTLGDAIEVFDSKRIPLSKREREGRPGIYPYYGAASIVDYIDDFIFDGVYLLVGEDGSVINNDKTPVIQYVWGKFWVNNHAHVLTGKGEVTVEQLFCCLRQTNIQPFVTGAVQPKLNQSNLNKIPFVQAEPEINRLFGEMVDTLFALIRSNVEQSRTLAALRDTLLPKLISGEIRVPVNDIH